MCLFGLPNLYDHILSLSLNTAHARLSHNRLKRKREKEANCIVEEAFFNSRHFDLHCRKSTSVTNNINNASVLFRCPSKS